MLDIIEHLPGQQLEVVNRPNCSMSRLGNFYLVLITGLISLVVAMGFAWIGAWPVIAFAITNIFGLSMGFQQVRNRSGDYEKLTLEAGVLTLEFKDDGQIHRKELNAYWVSVWMERLPDGGCKKLTLSAHGREIRFGRHLCETTRLHVGDLLESRLGKGFSENERTARP